MSSIAQVMRDRGAVGIKGIAWAMRNPKGETAVCAVAGTGVIYRPRGTDEWRGKPHLTMADADDTARRITSEWEEDDMAIVSGPLEFEVPDSMQATSAAIWTAVGTAAALALFPLGGGDIYTYRPITPLSRPQAGDLHYDSILRAVKVWDGDTWVRLGMAGE